MAWLEVERGREQHRIERVERTQRAQRQRQQQRELRHVQNGTTPIAPCQSPRSPVSPRTWDQGSEHQPPPPPPPPPLSPFFQASPRDSGRYDFSEGVGGSVGGVSGRGSPLHDRVDYGRGHSSPHDLDTDKE